MAIDYAYNFSGATSSGLPTSGNQLQIAAPIALGSGNFTIEFWIKFKQPQWSSSAASPTSLSILGGGWDTTTRISSDFLITKTLNPATVYFACWVGVYPAGSPTQVSGNYNFSSLGSDSWHHLAVCRSGSTLLLYANGSQIGTTSITGTINPSLSWYLNSSNGSSSGPVNLCNFYLADHRIVTGTALYTGSTYTVPTSGLTAISGTVLLTGTQAVLYDDGNSHYAITNNTYGAFSSVDVVANGPFGNEGNLIETLTLSDTTDATVGTTLAQRFTSAGVLQIPGTFDEYGPSNGSDAYTDAIASYPSTITSTSLSYSGTPGIFTWTCPPGVTNVSVVCVGGGGAGGVGGGSGGGGGGLGYKNNITVVPGQTYTVVAGAGGVENVTDLVKSGSDSYFISTSIVKGGGGIGGLVGGALRAGGAGGTYVGDGGGNGGAGGSAPGTRYDGSQSSAGGGAGGYSGTGGVGANGAGFPSSAGGNPASGSGGGGGGSNGRDSIYGYPYAAGGGGVGLLGKGSDGSGGAADNSSTITGGKGGIGGSGGTNGGIPTGALAPYGGIDGSGRAGAGGLYGGGGGAGQSGGGAGGAGAVRIVWNTPASTVFPNASGITWPDSRLTSEGNLFTKSSFDEYTLQTTYPNAYSYTDTAAYSVRINPSAGTIVTYVQTSGGNGAVFNARSNNWTIEFWFKTSTYSTGGNGQTLLDLYSGSTWAFMIYFNNSGTEMQFYDGTNNQTGSLNSAYTLNQWNHFALVCNTTLTLYINGVAQSGWNGITNNIVSNAQTTNITQFQIAGGYLGVSSADMYYSQYRINNSTSVYTGNFTPPSRLSATQRAGTNINSISGGTILLTCNSLSFVDQSSNAFTLTPYYNPGGGGGAVIPTVYSTAPTFSVDRIYNAPTEAAPTLNYARKQTVSSYQVYDSIDEVSLAYTITPNKTIMNEGDTVTYTINAPLSRSTTLYYTNTGTTAAADFSGGLVYGVTPLTWSGTATAALWSFTGLTQSATSGSGTGAVFSIRKNNATTTMGTHGVLTVIPTSPGSGYQIGDTITIAGASLGLTTPTNNLTITVGSDWFAQAVYSTTITGTGLAAVAGTPGSFNWTCPDGVYRISIAAVGGGGGGGSGAGAQGGGGGALGYNTDYAVVPGTVYPVVAGIGGAAGVDGGTSYFTDNLVGALFYAGGGQSAWPGGTASSGLTQFPKYSGFVGFSGGNGAGGAASPAAQGGGGGAGGFTANGGDGGLAFGSTGGGTGSLLLQLGKNSASGGGGGSSGGGAGVLDSVGTAVNTSTGNGGGGGGVLLLGVSNLGVGGVNLAGSSGAILGQSGTGGSGGATGGAASATVGGAGGAFGGGGGGGSTTGGAGGAGALRIIWNYPHGFLPEQTALSIVGNTKLLTSQSATITDVTGLNTIGNIATVVAGTTIIPFAGTYSNQFNGTTQYLYVPSSSNFVFGATDDFTIEGYLYTSATTINKGLIYKRSGSNISSVNFGTSTTTASRFTLKVANVDGSAWTVNDETAGTFAINTWYHFAITKTNGVIYLYINGLMVRQYAHTTAIYDDGSSLNIGQDPGGAKWVGYLSNIRIIKGTALYYPPSTIVKRNFPDYPSVVQNSGSIPITNGTGTLALTVGQDILQEGVQDIKLQLRSGSTSGAVLATAPTVVVADTSRPLALPGGGQCMCAYPDYVSGPNLVYTGTPGVFTFTAPKGYTAVSAVAIGAGGAGGYNGGGGGGGGALSYSASIAVTAGTTYTITCGAPGTTNGGTSSAGGASSFASTVIANGGQPGGGPGGAGGAGGTVGAGTGFAGGAGGAVSAGGATYSAAGGGGAGGYTAVGGVGGAVTGTWPTLTAASGAASATGGAGGGAGGSATAGAYYAVGGGGGGTSPFGSVAVASLAGIAYAGASSSCGRGGGGSGGNPTTTAFGVQLGEKGYTSVPYPNGENQPPHGGRFGGGGGGGDGNSQIGGNGGVGCVRIIWGTGRAYPSTLTADRVSGYPAAVGNPTGQQ